MANNKSKAQKIKQGFLIAFVSISLVLIVITLILNFTQFSDSSGNAGLENYLVNLESTATPLPSPTAVIELDASPTPTLAYWEIQE
jgi:hypothetical protein